MEEVARSYPSPSQLCREWGLKPHKGLGQNFLAREDILQDMAGFFSVPESAFALEIGPGLGHLSQALTKAGYEVLALEIDHDLKPLLTDLSRRETALRVLFQDAREADWEQLIPSGRPAALFGNLPYYLSSELFCKSFVEAACCQHMVMLLQKEAAQRLGAHEGSKLYGPAAILAALYGKLARVRQVPASAFFPPPTVVSSALFLQGGGVLQTLSRKRREAFFSLLKQAFSTRRKTLNNSLKDTPWGVRLASAPALSQTCGSQRAEALSPLQWFQLFLDLEECA